MVIVVLKLVYHRTISDRELTLGFLCGTFLSQFLLILIIFDRFFRDLPKRMVLLAILLAGLAVPSTWMLSTAKIYEAAISGGQFFLMSGFLAALAASDWASPSAWRLALAGTLWALAIGARNVLVLPIGFMVLMSAYWLYKTSHRSVGRLLIALISLGCRW